MSLLNSHAVEYLLIGGYAVSLYGYPRPTGDLDVWVGTSQENIARLEAVLRAFGFQVQDLFADLTSQPGRIWRFGVVPLRVEILTRISGVEFNDCYQRRLARELDGVTINLIDVADLRANKRASGRRKDLVDLDHLP